MNTHMNLAGSLENSTTEGKAAVLLLELLKKQEATRLDDAEHQQLCELEALLLPPEPLSSQ